MSLSFSGETSYNLWESPKKLKVARVPWETQGFLLPVRLRQRELIKQHYGSHSKKAPRESIQHKKKASSQLVTTKHVLFCRQQSKQQ